MSKMNPQLTFNSELELIGFRTTGPWDVTYVTDGNKPFRVHILVLVVPSLRYTDNLPIEDPYMWYQNPNWQELYACWN